MPSLIAAVRRAGAGVQLIPDGDIAGVIWTTDPKETGIDIYFGIGGAPEGVLGRGGTAVHRRPDAGPAAPAEEGGGGARRGHGRHRHQAQIRA